MRKFICLAIFALWASAASAQTLTLDTTVTPSGAGTKVTSGGVLVEERIPSAAGESVYRLLRMPNADGTSGQPLKTDGSGNLSFGGIAFSVLTGTPTTRAGYGITDAQATILTGTTGSIGGGALTASCASGTATIANSTTSMVAVASPNADISAAAYSVTARVSVNGTVTVLLCGTGTPTAGTYNVRVIP